MTPAAHYRMKSRLERLAISVALFGAFVFLCIPAAWSSPNWATSLMLWRGGGRPSVIEVFAVNLLTNGLALLFVVVFPRLVYRWFIPVHCPRCAARIRRTTTAPVRYVCTECGHCHDAGTMKSLADRDGRRFEH